MKTLLLLLLPVLAHASDLLIQTYEYPPIPGQTTTITAYIHLEGEPGFIEVRGAYNTELPETGFRCHCRPKGTLTPTCTLYIVSSDQETMAACLSTYPVVFGAPIERLSRWQALKVTP